MFLCPSHYNNVSGGQKITAPPKMYKKKAPARLADAPYAFFLLTFFLLVACEVEGEGEGSVVVGIEQGEVEGDDVGGVVVGELQGSDGLFAVHILGSNSQVAGVGGAVVLILIGDTADLVQFALVAAKGHHVLGEGEVGVGAVEVQTEGVGLFCGAVHAGDVGTHQDVDELGGGHAVGPVGVVQVGGALHTGVVVYATVAAVGDIVFLASGEGEGQGCKGSDKQGLFHDVFFNVCDYLICFFSLIRTE